MRRFPRPPLPCIWLAAIAATATSLCSSNSFAEPSTAAPRVAATTANQAATTAPTTPPADPLLEQIDQAIEVTSKRHLTANVHSPWQIFHGILAMKRDFQLKLGEEKVNALQWIATSEPRFDNQPLLLKTAHGGKFHPFTRPWAFEGHPSQFLALMSQSDLPVDYSFKVGDEKITVADMVQNTMKEVNSQEEVTWVLWALQHYLKPDTQWVNQHGEAWSIEKLVQIETAAPVVGAACGGNHRLFALTRTRDKHLQLGGKLNGIWAQADLKIRQHVELARQLQNSDGSFSAKFYQAPGVTNDLNERFNTTGHTMEFLSIGLPNNRLNEPWVRNAVSVLARELVQFRARPIDCGPLYHSLNSLMIYRERLRAPMPAAVAAKAAEPAKVTPAPKPESGSTPLVTTPTPTTLKDRLESISSPALTVVRKPTEIPNPVGPSDNISKPAAKGTPGESAPNALTPSVGTGSAATNSAATKPPTLVPYVTILKTIDPGRVVEIRPIEHPIQVAQPGLLPNVAATPIKAFELPFNDPDSFDTTFGTLKPRFDNPPAASRVIPTKPGARTISIDTPAPLTSPVGNEPASAIAPANRGK
ncbi:MAG: hypothetical protein AABP62_28485 [Planctomycetota bacterium]